MTSLIRATDYHKNAMNKLMCTNREVRQNTCIRVSSSSDLRDLLNAEGMHII